MILGKIAFFVQFLIFFYGLGNFEEAILSVRRADQHTISFESFSLYQISLTFTLGFVLQVAKELFLFLDK